MKVTLLKLVRQRAKHCAHIVCISRSYDAFRELGRSVTVGFATEKDYADFRDIEKTDEDTFDRKVRQRYWELNRDYYQREYGKHV